MEHLYQRLATLAESWRRQGYPCQDFPAIVEIKDARFKTAADEDIARDGRGEKPITVEGRKALAVRKWERLNPDRVKEAAPC
ncbi:MAG: hypothetical protein HY748_02140 [Elusimicrobia bacterium]|nr:hypothetical protein [Elusimicrobiota bacterium]